MKKHLILLGSIALFASGCATLISGTKQKMSVISDPPRAEVFLDGESVGMTPLVLKVEKNAFDTISVEKNGYQPQTKELFTEIDPASFFNLVNPVALFIDLVTGSMFKYEDNVYQFHLEKNRDMARKSLQ